MIRKNRTKVIKGVALLAVAILTATLAEPAKVWGSEYDAKIEAAQDAKDELEQKKQELEEKLEELEDAKDDVVDYIEKLDTELADIQADIDELTTEISDVEADLKETKQELKEAKETEENQYATMKKRIQYMYENGDTSLLDILLSSDSIADLLNQVEYVEQITEYDNSLLEKYTETKEKVKEMKEELQATLEEKNALNDELTANQDALEQLMSDKQTELAKYEKKITTTENETSDYDAQIADQENEINELLKEQQEAIIAEEKAKAEEEAKKKAEEEAAAKKKAEEEAAAKKEEESSSSSNSSSSSSSSDSSSSSGSSSSDSSSNTSASGFIWPVPSSSYISCGFGYRTAPTSGASTYHQGIDIGASSGSNIIAAKSGTVVTASYSVGAGNYIMINHGSGVFTVYMHCSKLLVSVGDTVSQGDVIALVGSTGISTGPHLHFGISINGTYVDPQNYVSP